MSTRKIFRIAASLALFFVLPGLAAHSATISTGIDTYVREANPTTSYGGQSAAQWDGDDGAADNHALLYFNIFSDEGGPIDPAAIARFPNLRAYVKFEVVDEGDAGTLHRMTTGFDENTTWDDLGGGVRLGANAITAPDATTNAMQPGTHYVDVTSSIQAWASSPGSNMGWGILPTDTNGLEFATFESGSGPQLIIGNALDLVTMGSGGSTWSYYDSIPAPPDVGSDQYPIDGSGNDWTDLDFDDSGWGTGTGQFGFGDGDETTVLAEVGLTYLFRTTFMANGAADELWIELLRDDAAVVFLNGTEVLRDNLPGGVLDPSISASGTGDENALDWFQIDETLLLVGQLNILTVEIHNASLTSSDISFDLGLTVFNPIPISAIPEPNSLLLVMAGLTILAASRRHARRGRRRSTTSRA